MMTYLEIRSAMFTIKYNLDIIQIMRLTLAAAGELSDEVLRAYDIAEKGLSESYMHLCNAINLYE